MTSKAPKPPLLLVSGLSPWPTTSGGAVRIFETLKHLSRTFSIHFVCAREPNEATAEIQKQCMPYCASFTTFQKQTNKSFFTYLAKGVPYWFSEWHNPELALIARNLISQHAIKLVQIETTQLLYLVPKLPKTVTSVCTAYDVQFISFWRRLNETQNWLSKVFKLALLLQVWRYEAVNLKLTHQVIAVSDIDRAFFEKIYGLSKVVVIPNGYAEQSQLQRKPHHKLMLGFIGATSHSPNITAIRYLVQKIAPELKKHRLEFEIILAGDTTSLTAELRQAPSHTTVTQLGFVPKLSDFYQKIDVLVAPLFSGSGTRIKILESLAHGVPVVTTSIGAEGIERDQIEGGLLLANSPQQFVEQLLQIHAREKGATAKIELSLTWQVIFQKLSLLLVELLRKNQTPA